MENGIRILGSSMKYLKDKIDTISNNISNTDTEGYKKDTVIGKAFNTVLSDTIANAAEKGYNQSMLRFRPGVYVDEIHTRFSQGPLQETSKPWDLAIQGEGFFATESDNGVLYKRSLSMTKDAEGFLATDRGNRVLGQTGPIYVGDNEFTVEENGALRINGLIVDRLVIVDFENKGQLSKAETGGFRNEGSPIIEAAGDILQGYLESSNVDLSEEMTNLIEISNKFTTHQRLVQMMDEISSISSNRLGKV